jgi:group I intron endonuclease
MGEEMTSGIYKIENKVNNRFYIGSSVNIENRWGEHISQLRKNKHANYHLQKDWNQFGEKCFIFSVMKKIRIHEDILNAEQELIDRFYDFGKVCYNISRFVDAPANVISEDELLRLHELLKENQDKKIPTLSIHQMKSITGREGIGSLLNVLNLMVRHGLAKEVEWGEQKRYRFL